MKVRFQYTDFSEWEGPPEDAHESPDIRPPDGGIVRMFAIDDFDRTVTFVYDDFYYLYPVDGGWLFGSGTPKREFILKAGQDGATPLETFNLPDSAVVRHGKEVSREDAVTFGLIGKGGKLLTPIRDVIVVAK